MITVTNVREQCGAEKPCEPIVARLSPIAAAERLIGLSLASPSCEVIVAAPIRLVVKSSAMGCEDTEAFLGAENELRLMYTAAYAYLTMSSRDTREHYENVRLIRFMLSTDDAKTIERNNAFRRWSAHDHRVRSAVALVVGVGIAADDTIVDQLVLLRPNGPRECDLVAILELRLEHPEVAMRDLIALASRAPADRTAAA